MKKSREQKTKALAEQLKAAIGVSGLSVYAVAKTAGVKHAVVARFLAGERDIRLETAGKIADVLVLELHPRHWGSQ